MQRLLKRTARFAKNHAPVTVMGETGTGKEVIARILHANSPRASAPFVAVNVAALPAQLLESELFGHGKGAFTGASGEHRGLFEAADKGTLFLDEIGEMPQALQAKLLRVLQDGEVRRVGESKAFSVDVRIISATHRNLLDHVKGGLFREDLYYRLKVLSLRVPPLRERMGDILPLAHHFLGKEQTDAKGFSSGAEEELHAYRWPGNVRELENTVKHGAALADGALIEKHDLPEELSFPHARAASEIDALSPPPKTAPLGTLAEVERRHILEVIEQCDGSQSQAAAVLGIARNTLWRKLKKLRELA